MCTRHFIYMKSYQGNPSQNRDSELLPKTIETPTNIGWPRYISFVVIIISPFFGQGEKEKSEYKLNPSVLIENILKREKCVEPCTRDGPLFKAGVAWCGVKDLHCVQVDKVAVHHKQLLMKMLIKMMMNLMMMLTIIVMMIGEFISGFAYWTTWIKLRLQDLSYDDENAHAQYLGSWEAWQEQGLSNGAAWKRGWWHIMKEGRRG